MFALSLAATTPAFAHALLRSANPPVGSTVRQAPRDLSLTYSESVEPEFCHVTVTNAAGASVAPRRCASTLMMPSACCCR